MGTLAVVGAAYPIERVGCATQSDNLLGQCLCGRLAERLIGFESFDAGLVFGCEPVFRCRHESLGTQQKSGRFRGSIRNAWRVTSVLLTVIVSGVFAPTVALCRLTRSTNAARLSAAIDSASVCASMVGGLCNTLRAIAASGSVCQSPLCWHAVAVDDAVAVDTTPPCETSAWRLRKNNA